MDCLQELSESDLPLSHISVIKYVVLRWFMNYGCQFREPALTDIEKLRDWWLSNDFSFEFGEKNFHLSIVNETTVQTFRINLGYAEGSNVVSIKHAYVPEFLTKRPFTTRDAKFVFELNHKLEEIFYEKVFRRIIHDFPIENVGSTEGVLEYPNTA